MLTANLLCIGVSGDGDSASIGVGQFAHIIRRKINMLYIVDNNGTLWTDQGSVLRHQRPRFDQQARRAQSVLAD